MPLPAIDLALRSGTTALLLMLAVTLLRDHGRTTAGRLAAGFALGSAAFAVSSAAGFGAIDAAWRAPLIALSTGNVVIFWLFAQALFNDEFRLRWWHAAVWIALVCTSLFNCLVLAVAQTPDPGMLGAALSLIALAFNALAIIQALTTWSTDLVEERRRLRLFIVVAAALYGAAYAGQQLLLKASELPMRASVANAIVLALIVAAIAAALTRSSGDTIFPVAGSTGEMPETPPAGVATTSLDAADRKLVATLDRLMQYDRVYRHDNMTIGTLALKLGVPEYRLRRLINRTLGYRNFNAFLNNYRIEEAKAALADPAQIKVPVLTIAMDAGFQSLGPFNRAFKTTTGVTPTEYRRLRSAAA